MLAPRMAPRYVEPSAKVSSRTPGAISRPGSVSAALGGVAGADTWGAAGTGAGVFVAGAGGGADGWVEAITAGLATGCETGSAGVAAGACCGGTGGPGGGFRTTSAGS